MIDFIHIKTYRTTSMALNKLFFALMLGAATNAMAVSVRVQEDGQQDKVRDLIGMTTDSAGNIVLQLKKGGGVVDPQTGYSISAGRQPVEGGKLMVRVNNGTSHELLETVLPKNANIKLEAVANTGWEFDRWQVTAGCSENRCEFTMDGPKGQTAVFKQTGGGGGGNGDCPPSTANTKISCTTFPAQAFPAVEVHPDRTQITSYRIGPVSSTSNKVGRVSVTSKTANKYGQLVVLSTKAGDIDAYGVPFGCAVFGVEASEIQFSLNGSGCKLERNKHYYINIVSAKPGKPNEYLCNNSNDCGYYLNMNF